MSINPPAPKPCESCPYRKDVPSGVWSEGEYRKLPQYDLLARAIAVGLMALKRRVRQHPSKKARALIRKIGATRRDVKYS
jgi:hypothetical protein